jgi:hypothetical protein
VTAKAGVYPPESAVGVTSSRLDAVCPAARIVHRAILLPFATTGHVPDPGALADATPAGHELGGRLAQLHDHDVIRLDERGRIRAADPFSGLPTPHTVAIHGGPTVHAMCAIDALGICQHAQPRHHHHFLRSDLRPGNQGDRPGWTG